MKRAAWSLGAAVAMLCLLIPLALLIGFFGLLGGIGLGCAWVASKLANWGVRVVAFFTTRVLPVVALLVFVTGCAAHHYDPADTRVQDFVRWSRHYASVMGLPEGDIVVGNLDGLCGALANGRDFKGSYVLYDPRNRQCALFTGPRETALHEQCHRRMQHDKIQMSREEMEAEVAVCMKAYRKR